LPIGGSAGIGGIIGDIGDIGGSGCTIGCANSKAC